tara:strand:- start:681 stop:1133 length:453 start_codon:yes stop_codon:yes gene_type:complete
VAYNKSKAKGSSYEAKIAALLTKELNMEFKRVPLSGAIAYLKGDIWVPSDTAAFEYTIECKHYAEVNWNGLLTAKSSDLISFWNQAVREADVMKKLPLVIYKWNRSKDYVCWKDDIELESQIHYKGFGCDFKMGLLQDWLQVYKSLAKSK